MIQRNPTSRVNQKDLFDPDRQFKDEFGVDLGTAKLAFRDPGHPLLLVLKAARDMATQDLIDMNEPVSSIYQAQGAIRVLDNILGIPDRIKANE